MVGHCSAADGLGDNSGGLSTGDHADAGPAGHHHCGRKGHHSGTADTNDGPPGEDVKYSFERILYKGAVAGNTYTVGGYF